MSQNETLEIAGQLRRLNPTFDDRAFEVIFDRYGPALLSFCTHMLGSREWGEDALQLTFVAAYKALRRGGCDGALRPWLYAIARNRCVSVSARSVASVPSGSEPVILMPIPSGLPRCTGAPCTAGKRVVI